MEPIARLWNVLGGSSRACVDKVRNGGEEVLGNRGPTGLVRAEPTSASAVPVSAVRPRLRHDVVFAESLDGAFVRHADDGFVVKGRSAYRWISALSPHLTGENTVGELCAGLPDEQRETVVHLIGTLLERGFVRDRRPDEDATLDGAVRVRFTPQINFVEHYVDDAVTRFTAFRESAVLCMGDGPLVRSAALSALRNGLRALHLDGAGAQLVDELEACAEELRAAGAPAEIRHAGPSDRYDVVVAAAEEVGLSRLGSLAAALPYGTVLLPVLEVAGKAIVGPATQRTRSPCWTCALLRLDANLPARAMAEVWRGLATAVDRPRRSRMSTPPARMLGTALAFDVFRMRTGCLPAETGSSLLVVDLDTLTSTREHLLAHPACPTCGGRQPSAAEPAVAASAADPPSEREVHDRYWSLVDPHAGVFSAFLDDDLRQSPVKTARVRLGPSPSDGGEGRRLVAFDLTNVLAARNRAVRAAATVYADAIGCREVRQRGAVERMRAISAVAAPESIPTWTGRPVEAGSDLEWVAARSLLDDGEWLVPAAAVHRASTDDGPLFDRLGAGAGAGTTEAEAVDEGLRSALAHRALRAALAGTPAVEPDRMELAADAEIALLTDAAGHLGWTPRVVLLPSDGLAVVALVSAQRAEDADAVWLVRAGWSTRHAVRDALRDLIGTLQMGADAEVDAGEPLIADVDPNAITTIVRLENQRPASAVRWQCRAVELGVEPLVVDTTPPDLRAVLRTVRVVLHVGSVQGRR